MAYCLALCAAAMAVAAAPCLADDVTKTDEVGDVRFYEVPNGPSGPLVGFDVPVHRNGDLRRAYVRYGEKRIRVVMRFRELRRREPVLGVQDRLRWPARGQFHYGEAVIGSPRWIQFNASTFTADDDEDPSYFYIDSIYPVIDENDDGSVSRFTRRIFHG